VRRGGRFTYRDLDGRPLRDAAQIDRIRRLAIPPAYESVWICALPHGHLQATGRDARGRKQYRYHPEWREQRDGSKFERLAAFGRALPRIRARVQRDLRQRASELPRTLVLATLVRLLDTTFVRVGNDEYARSNGSFGLTTLRNRHAGVRGGVLSLNFRGKSGVAHRVSVEDARITRVVRHCQQLPGQELFQYLDDAGFAHTIDSADVNDYLAEAAGERFTAKDFRTWHGSVQALQLALRVPGDGPAGVTSAKRRVVQLVAEVASLLGNTVAVCRKSYIHPAILDLATALAISGDPADAARVAGAGARGPRGLGAAERRLLGFLRAAEPQVRGRRAPRRPIAQTA
jgi:DNA topoisomerase-1